MANNTSQSVDGISQRYYKNISHEAKNLICYPEDDTVEHNVSVVGQSKFYEIWNTMSMSIKSEQYILIKKSKYKKFRTQGASHQRKGSDVESFIQPALDFVSGWTGIERF